VLSWVCTTFHSQCGRIVGRHPPSSPFSFQSVGRSFLPLYCKDTCRCPAGGAARPWSAGLSASTHCMPPYQQAESVLLFVGQLHLHRSVHGNHAVWVLCTACRCDSGRLGCHHPASPRLMSVGYPACLAACTANAFTVAPVGGAAWPWSARKALSLSQLQPYEQAGPCHPIPGSCVCRSAPSSNDIESAHLAYSN
jgi:hypothetical protein